MLKKLKRDLKNILINFINPYLALNCRLKSISVFFNAYIYCFSDKPIKEGIFLENQIAYTKDNEGLILINQYTFLKDNLKLKKRIENIMLPIYIFNLAKTNLRLIISRICF